MAVIKKDARGGRGTYATLAQVVNYVDEQGFDLQWPTQLVDGRLYVDTAVRKKGTDKWIASNCLIPVEVGDSRGMSVMQALGSALTYARRYSTCGAFGLATTDDDGETSGYKKRSVKGMTDEQKTQRSSSASNIRSTGFLKTARFRWARRTVSSAMSCKRGSLMAR